MSKVHTVDAATRATILAFVQQERCKSVSRHEWKHRLAGYGYAITATDQGEMITTLPHGLEICPLPATMAH